MIPLVDQRDRVRSEYQFSGLTPRILTLLCRWLGLKRTRPRLSILVPSTSHNTAHVAHAGPGQLKAKLAKLKRELLTPSSSGGSGGGKNQCDWVEGSILTHVKSVSTLQGRALPVCKFSLVDLGTFNG
jgi:hypothetical protein